MSKEIDPAQQATDQPRGETQEAGSPPISLQSIDWKQEVSNGLSWLDGRAWSVGGFLLFLSVLCLHHYATQTGASLSVTSGNLITSLPSMLALVIFAAVMLVLGLMMPTVVLFTPLSQGGPPLLQAVKQGEALLGRGFVLAWIAVPVVVGVVLLVVISLFSQSLPINRWFTGVVLLVCGSAFFGCLAWLLKRSQKNLGLPAISWDMWFVASLAAFVQLFCVIFMMSFVARRASLLGVDSLLLVIGFLVLGTFVLGLLQLAGVALFEQARRQPSPVRYMTIVAAIVLLVMILLPPVGGALAAYAIQVPASAGQGCSVLIWSPAAGEEVQALRDEKDPALSKPLRILLDDGDRYQVRLREKAEGVRFVPRASVMGFDPCPKP